MVVRVRYVRRRQRPRGMTKTMRASRVRRLSDQLNVLALRSAKELELVKRESERWLEGRRNSLLADGFSKEQEGEEGTAL